MSAPAQKRVHGRVANPSVSKYGKKIGRPRKDPPEAQRIEDLAAEGHGVVGVARMLKVNAETLRVWFDEDPGLLQAYENGRERERFHLHELLRQKADKGNIIAMLFLLKSRHGYTEGTEGSAPNRLQITFTMPAAMRPDQFVVEQQTNGRATEALPVPTKSLTRS